MESQLGNIASVFSQFVEQPELYLSAQNSNASKLKASVKDLYDITKTVEESGLVKGQGENDALPELIIDQFDDEQVWQELELQNGAVMSGLLSDLAKLTATSNKSKKSDKIPQSKATQPQQEKQKEDDPLSEDILSEEGDELDDDFMERLRLKEYDSDESEEERMLKELLDKEIADSQDVKSESDHDGLAAEDDDDDDLDFSDFLDQSKMKRTKIDEDEDGEQNDTMEEGDEKHVVFGKSDRQVGANLFKQRQPSVVDDKFFCLAEMESFLDKEDQKEERKIARERGETQAASDDEDSEDDFDMLYEDHPSEGDEGSDSDDKDVMYEDFFGAAETEPDSAKKFTGKTPEQDDDESDTDGEDSQDEDSDDLDKQEQEVKDPLPKTEEKTTFEKRQERLKQKIADLEEAALDEKPWQLSGETSGSARPINSLLEENLDFEQQTRAAPPLTEETTKSIEDIIKQRIKDKCFDDVERKDKPKEEMFEYRKRIALNQEKSKLNLGEVYEQEYLRQQQDEEDDKKDPVRDEVTKMMTSLFLKLDALSNFHFAPKPAAPEVKIVSNLPSVKMEEVLPVGVSDKTVLAPEEIKGKTKWEVRGDTEKTKTDKLRERKNKKRKKRLQQQEREKREEKKPSKKVKDADESEKSKEKQKFTSSSQFFTQLQEEAKTQIRGETKTVKEKRKKKPVQMSDKLKL